MRKWGDVVLNTKVMRCAMCFQIRIFTKINFKPGISKISIKSQIVNILDLVGHTVSVTTCEPYYHSVKAITGMPKQIGVSV